MKGLKRMDEMNVHISLLSTRFSYIFTLIALFIWAIVCFVNNERETFLKLVAILNIQFFILLILFFNY